MKQALGSRIVGFGHFAPDNRVENASIEKRLGLEPGWIERRTGIRARRWASPDEALSDLAEKAGEAALDDAGIARRDIALTLLATSTPDHLLPPSAPAVAHRLGLERSGAADLAGACSGFLYALTLADGFVRAQARPALVIAANILSRRINPDERASAILFADAAGAVILAPSEDPAVGILSVDLAADGSLSHLISIKAGGSRSPFSAALAPEDTLMHIADGRAVFVEAVRMMSDCGARALERAAVPPEAVNRFVPHQANARIFEAVCQKLRLPPRALVRTIEEYGNSSAATIALSLSITHRDRPFAAGERLLMIAAGAGFAGGAMVVGF